MIKVKLWKLYIAPFLVVGAILLNQYIDVWLQSRIPFSTLASQTHALVKLKKNNLITATVAKVVDGDTIELTTGEKVRYIGIDTPETKHPKKRVECFGREAAQKNKALVEGKTVLLEKDVSDTDRYGRLLRYIYLPNPENSLEAIFVNEYLVEQGYAYLLTYPPDLKYNDIIRHAQTQARNQRLGLWNKCN